MHFRKIFPLLAALVLVVPALPASAEEPPAIAVLRYSQGWFTPRAKIRIHHGMTASPLAGTTKVRWVLEPGDTLKRASPPVERLIQLYTIKGSDVRVLCTVLVKYVRTRDGWQPAFSMVQQAESSGGDDKSSMLSDEGTTRATMRIIAGTPADGDGFRTSLVFADAEGPVSIDAWDVQ